MSAATASASILMRRELFSVLQQQQRRWTTTASQGWCGCSSVSSSSSSSTATCQEQSSSLIRRRRRTMPSQNVGYTPDLDHSVIFPVSGSRPLSSWTSTFHGRRRRRSDVPQAKSWPSQPKPVASAPNEEPDPNHGTPPDDSTTINTILHTTATDNAVPLSSSTTTTPTASSSSSTQSLSSAASRRQQRWIDQLQSPPNLLTLSRIAATPLLCYWVITHQTHYAIVGCCLAAASDAADGLLARHGNMTTTLGTYLDPLADKLLINGLSISLWVNGTLPTPLVGLWLAKDVVLMTATYFLVVKSTTRGGGGVSIWEDPVTFPLQVNPTTISKVNTALQFATLALGIAHPIVLQYNTLLLPVFAASAEAMPHPSMILPALCWLTGLTTVASVASYAVGRHSALTTAAQLVPPVESNTDTADGCTTAAGSSSASRSENRPPSPPYSSSPKSPRQS